MKKNSPLKLLHLALMVILMFGSSFSTVMFFTRNEAAVAGKGEMEVILNGCSTLVVVLMLITGILYLIRGYKKNVAAIVADVTIGLAIRGKYEDKESRGSN